MISWQAEGSSNSAAQKQAAELLKTKFVTHSVCRASCSVLVTFYKNPLFCVVRMTHYWKYFISSGRNLLSKFIFLFYKLILRKIRCWFAILSCDNFVENTSKLSLINEVVFSRLDKSVSGGSRLFVPS